MGYYTELEVNIILNEHAPLDVLEKLSNGEMWEELSQAKFGRSEGLFSVAEEPELPIEHEFGKSSRWSQIFNLHTTVFNKKNRTLIIKCDIKAYDEIYDHLRDWLEPFIVSGTIKEKGESCDQWFIYHYENQKLLK